MAPIEKVTDMFIQISCMRGSRLKFRGFLRPHLILFSNQIKLLYFFAKFSILIIEKEVTIMLSLLVVIFAIIARPLSSLIGKIVAYGIRRQADQDARRRAMARYLNSQILDIEH